MLDKPTLLQSEREFDVATLAPQVSVFSVVEASGGVVSATLQTGECGLTLHQNEVHRLTPVVRKFVAQLHAELVIYTPGETCYISVIYPCFISYTPAISVIILCYTLLNQLYPCYISYILQRDSYISVIYPWRSRNPSVAEVGWNMDGL